MTLSKVKNIYHYDKFILLFVKHNILINRILFICKAHKSGILRGSLTYCRIKKNDKKRIIPQIGGS